MKIYKTYYDSKIGEITIFSDGDNIIEIRLPNDKYPIKYDNIIKKDNLDVFKVMKNWLDDYFKGQMPKVEFLPLKFIGTTFQKRVWKILLEIPFGEVVTYKEIAKKISPKMSAQAVGGAVGHNPICIVIPCHRVIGSNNKLVGFRAGIDTKRWLLEHEGIKI